MTTYTTKQGDTFDMVARAVYGNEKLIAPLLDANPAHVETILFPAGVILSVPAVAAAQASSELPPWRRA